jgi:hypothetical protein
MRQTRIVLYNVANLMKDVPGIEDLQSALAPDIDTSRMQMMFHENEVRWTQSRARVPAPHEPKLTQQPSS